MYQWSQQEEWKQQQLEERNQGSRLNWEKYTPGEDIIERYLGTYYKHADGGCTFGDTIALANIADNLIGEELKNTEEKRRGVKVFNFLK